MNSMKNRLGLCYTMRLINCHYQKHSENAVSSSNVNLASRKLQPKINKIHKIQQITKNEGKWNEARYQQVKKLLIMLNRLPEEK